MKPHVDEDLCTGCGNCEDECPEVFRVEDDGYSHVIVEEPGPELYGCTRDAADSCPTEAITITE
jgi:ferredoxin